MSTIWIVESSSFESREYTFSAAFSTRDKAYDYANRKGLAMAKTMTESGNEYVTTTITTPTTITVCVHSNTFDDKFSTDRWHCREVSLD